MRPRPKKIKSFTTQCSVEELMPALEERLLFENATIMEAEPAQGYICFEQVFRVVGGTKVYVFPVYVSRQEDGATLVEVGFLIRVPTGHVIQPWGKGTKYHDAGVNLVRRLAVLSEDNGPAAQGQPLSAEPSNVRVIPPVQPQGAQEPNKPGTAFLKGLDMGCGCMIGLVLLVAIPFVLVFFWLVLAILGA